MTPVIHTLTDTGTPNGITTALTVAWGCPRKAWLRKFTEQSSEEAYLAQSKPLLTGSIGHAFMERYYGKTPSGWKAATMKFSQIGEAGFQEECRMEAERVFRAYKTKHSPTEFGRVIGVEEYFEIELVLPSGVFPLTGRIDLVVSITKAKAKALQTARKISIKPGRYLVDHKFIGKMGALEHARYASSIQGPTYLRAYNQGKPTHKQAIGFIHNMITKTKAPEVFTSVSHAGGKLQSDIINATFVMATASGWPLLESYQPHCNPERCFDWMRVCSYLTSGRCKRI